MTDNAETPQKSKPGQPLTPYEQDEAMRDALASQAEQLHALLGTVDGALRLVRQLDEELEGIRGAAAGALRAPQDAIVRAIIRRNKTD